jgi:hypothetical protein
MRKIFIKKYFLFTAGSVCRVKRFSGKSFADDEEVETEMRKWLRQQSKYLYYCGFRYTGKAMGQVYQSWSRICRGKKFFFRLEYQVFLGFIPIYEIFTDSPSYIPSGNVFPRIQHL